MQALVGLQLAGLLGLILLWRLVRHEETVRGVLLFAATFVLIALPALGPLVYQQLAGSPLDTAQDGPSMFYVLAQVRVPHHYLFYSFPTRSLLRFGTLVLFGGISALLFTRHRPLPHQATLMGVFIGIIGLCLFAFVGTEIIPSLFVAQLQLFKTTVLAKLMLVILICGAVAVWLPAALARFLDRLLDFKTSGLVVILTLWALLIGGIVLDIDKIEAKIGPLAHEGTPQEQVETWARTQTPRDALFAVPPSWSGFRSRAERAIVVNFKAFPYREGLNEAWFERLTQWAPVALPNRGGPVLQERLDDAFFQLPPRSVLRLAHQYTFDYVVRDRSWTPSSPSFEQVFEAGDWVIYRIMATEESAE